MSHETVKLAEGGLHLSVDAPPAAEGRPILLLSAMGVPARFYSRFAGELAAAGHPVVRVHWRDEDRDFPKRNPGYGYAHLAEVDVPAAARYTRERFGADPVVVGHSLGGQIAATSAVEGGPYAGIVILASGTNHWRGSGPLWALGLLFVCCFWAPLVVRLVGFWPGMRFGFGGRQPRQMMLDWSRLGRTGKFLPAGARVDHERALAELSLPVLAFSVAGDHYVTPGAMQNLTKKLTGCEVDHVHWRAENHDQRGHFNWAKAEDGPSRELLAWIDVAAPSA